MYIYVYIYIFVYVCVYIYICYLYNIYIYVYTYIVGSRSEGWIPGPREVGLANLLPGLRPVFRSLKSGPSPWEIWTVKGNFEVKLSNGSGIWDPQFEMLWIEIWELTVLDWTRHPHNREGPGPDSPSFAQRCSARTATCTIRGRPLWEKSRSVWAASSQCQHLLVAGCWSRWRA